MTLTAQTRLEALWKQIENWCQTETYYSERDCYWCWRRQEEDGAARFILTIGHRVAAWFRLTEDELEEKPVEQLWGPMLEELRQHAVPEERRARVRECE